MTCPRRSHPRGSNSRETFPGTKSLDKFAGYKHATSSQVRILLKQQSFVRSDIVDVSLMLFLKQGPIIYVVINRSRGTYRTHSALYFETTECCLPLEQLLPCASFCKVYCFGLNAVSKNDIKTTLCSFCET